MALETDMGSSREAHDSGQIVEPPRVATAIASRLRKSKTTWAVFSVVLLSLLPRLLTIGRFTTFDEPVWRLRSSNFVDALGSGDFADASAIGSRSVATMPGVTTMWIGSLARGVWSAGRSLGLWSDGQTAFADSRAGLTIAQGLMALVLSALIGFLTFLVTKWSGSLLAGVIAGVLLATEPYFVALGAVLHTDELMSFLGIAAMLCTALVLGLPRRTSWQGRWWVAALAGGLFAGALLTKLSALTFLVGVGAMGAWALLRTVKTGRQLAASPDAVTLDSSESEPNDLDGRTIARIAATWVVTALAVFVVFYPALWVRPFQELEHLRVSAELGSQGHSQFYLGGRTQTPGPTYLFVTLPLRTTPWFLFAAVFAGLAIFWQRSLRGFGLLALCMALPIFVVISLAAKQAIRYALPVPAVGAIVIGIAGAAAITYLSSRTSSRVPAAWVGAAAVAFVLLHSVAVAPWGNAYFNPVLGGGSTAERVHTIGSGEGLDVAGDFIQEREAHRCNDVLIWTYEIRDAFPCGHVTSQRNRSDRAEYVVLYINQRQRQPPAFLEKLTENRELLDTVTIRGITFAEIFGPANDGASS